MKKALILIACLGLAACGVDGEPTRPPDVNAGVTINSSGVYPSVGIGWNAGPVRVGIGL